MGNWALIESDHATQGEGEDGARGAATDDLKKSGNYVRGFVKKSPTRSA